VVGSCEQNVKGNPKQIKGDFGDLDIDGKD
jgi:hypothetical protein